jgi:M6 family metalloprotease-like protein
LVSSILAFLAAAGMAQTSHAAATGNPPAPDLSGYRTVEQAVTTEIAKPTIQPQTRTGYLGISVTPHASHQYAVIVEVAIDSPATTAGLAPGDCLLKIDGRGIVTAEDLRQELQGRSPGQKVRLTIGRQGKDMVVDATLEATSRFVDMESDLILGMLLGDPLPKGGVPIDLVWGPPASKIKLGSGYVLLEADRQPLTDPQMLRELVNRKKAGDMVRLEVTDPKSGRGAYEVTLPVGPEPGDSKSGGAAIWKRDRFRLAVVGIEYPDVRHNPKITAADWSEMFFSRNRYGKKNNATGQPVSGSVSDYFEEQSCGAFHLEGKVFDWVQVSKKRAEYREGTHQDMLETVVLDGLLAREGKAALDGFDGILLIYAGGVPGKVAPGELYWPHAARGGYPYQNRRWPCAICPEGGAEMLSVGLVCHQFGHMLGLPDLCEDIPVADLPLVGTWCLMSHCTVQPLLVHLSAWCKEQLGWLRPAIIDPAVPQELILSPIEGSARECFKVPIRPDGSEYFLLENRRRKDVDAGLPGEGLLVWRVERGRPKLEASHGIEGTPGLMVLQDLVPYPSRANNSFTPDTTPASRSERGGGRPVFIAGIRRLPDGRVAFQIGRQYL